MSLKVIKDGEFDRVRAGSIDLLPVSSITVSSPLKGSIIYNSPDDTLQFANGAVWFQVISEDINGNVNLSGNLTVGGTLSVTGATTLNSTLSVTGATTLNSTLSVSGATTLSSTLSVTGNTTLNSNLSVSGTSTLTGNTLISGTLDVVGLTSLSDLQVSNNVGVGGTVVVTGDLTTFGDFSVAVGNATIGGTLGVTGLSTLSGGTQLPTSGGTSTTLDYYEEAIHNDTASGAIVNTPISITIVRIGKIVTIRIPDFIAAQSGVPGNINLTTLGNFPSRFAPANDPTYFTISVFDGNNGSVFGQLRWDSGIWFLGVGPNGGNFASDNTSGLQSGDITATYTVS